MQVSLKFYNVSLAKQKISQNLRSSAYKTLFRQPASLIRGSRFRCRRHLRLREELFSFRG